MVMAEIKHEDGEAFEFQFNPESISFTTKANWKDVSTQSGKDGPQQQFEGTDPISLKIDINLDYVTGHWEELTRQVNQLISWTNPTEKSTKKNKPSPPELTFSWGALTIGLSKSFKCHVNSVAVNYTMFHSDGSPIRAKVTVELVSITKTSPKQNPTSGGLRAHRVHIIQRGDQLATIAAGEYGTASYWRDIAAYNRIDDPTSLPIGSQIVLPAPQDIGSG